MSGEQLELIEFAALQLASGAKIEARNTLPQFCEELISFLAPKTPHDKYRVNEKVVSKLDIRMITYRGVRAAKDVAYGCAEASAYASELRTNKINAATKRK
mmetsp:Transcript_21467/g.31778  ORF Transcript_21467/g.31778 Transcript_21467/m.31778 type:complete len:101 (-) Transcript_21467:305-607(-)|eukprot:CAMPEP_0194221942 /NCGR_PEP_ID=MMETSP0156-20130528/31688_1 /TAXON_ID=33649 /ORGANISM="Thalassionema nitzschioides, Strain L26-B" /LENGTH=100 /DNA_ID=CAMNT_0038952515 /DNA_START=299 /DNA_END=601 /DNA_ORIENTATION=-